MKNFTILISGLMLLLLAVGCAPKAEPVNFEKEVSILYAEFMQEVNCFNPVYTTERDCLQHRESEYG